MKKTLFLAVLAGAALAGCVKNEEVATNDGSPERITFDAPVVTIPTKATEIVSNYPKDKDFGVYAYHTQSAIGVPTSSSIDGVMYMDNEQCVANNTEAPDYWSPADRDYYWPKNGYLTFAAYAPSTYATAAEGNAKLWPADAKVAWNAFGGFTFTDFTVNSEPNDQYDLLYSAPVYDQTAKSTVATDNPYDGITILFKHALSSIVFTAKTDGGSYNDKISITKIMVNNVYEKGDFAQNHYVDGGTTGTAAWTVKGELKNYKVYEDANGVELTATEAPINGTLDADENDGKSRSDLILMPQNLAAANRAAGSTDATVDITYKITHSNGDEPTTETVTFKLAAKGDVTPEYVWKMGMRYTYHITIGLNKIYFNPTVDVWTPVDGEVVGDGGVVEQI